MHHTAGAGILNAVSDSEKKRLCSPFQNPGFAIHYGGTEIPFRDILSSAVEVWDNNPKIEQMPDFGKALSAEKRTFPTCKPLLVQLVHECAGDPTTTALLIAAARSLETKHKQTLLDHEKKRLSRAQASLAKKGAVVPTVEVRCAAFEEELQWEFNDGGSAACLMEQIGSDLRVSFIDHFATGFKLVDEPLVDIQGYIDQLKKTCPFGWSATAVSLSKRTQEPSRQGRAKKREQFRFWSWVRMVRQRNPKNLKELSMVPAMANMSTGGGAGTQFSSRC